MGYPSVRYTLNDLFGFDRIRAVYDLPCNIGYLSDKLNRSCFQYSAEELIHKHTLFPLYEKFIPSELAMKIYATMIGRHRQSVQSMLGLTASNVPMLRRFRFCPECNHEYLKNYGELYINRIHQNSCVFVCPYHEMPLVNSDIDLKASSQRCFVYADMKHIKGGVLANGFDMSTQVRIAKAFDYIMSGRYSCAFKDIQSKYLELLSDKGLLSDRSVVDVKGLKVEFRRVYDENLLKSVGSVVDDKSNNWLPAIFRKHVHLFHPVRHVLVILFLSGSIEDFCHYKVSRCPRRRIPDGFTRNLIRHPRVDWAARDRETLSKVKKLVKRMLVLKDPFVRLTVHSVCYRTDEKDRILKSLQKLPLTRKYLASIVESHLQFQYRKVDSVIKLYGTSVLRKNLIYKMASISKHRYPEVDDYIDHLLEEIARGNVDEC